MKFSQYLVRMKREKVARNYTPLILKQGNKSQVIEVVSESPAILRARTKETIFKYIGEDGKPVFTKQIRLKTTIVQRSDRP